MSKFNDDRSWVQIASGTFAGLFARLVKAEIINPQDIGVLPVRRYTSLIGSSGALVALSGSVVFPVDLSSFVPGTIKLVLIVSGSADTWSVDIDYYYNSDTEKHDSATGIINGTGNRSADVSKHDSLADITINHATGSETCWAYLIGDKRS